MKLYATVKLVLDFILVYEGELLWLLKRCLWHFVKLLLSICGTFGASILFINLFVVIGN